MHSYANGNRPRLMPRWLHVQLRQSQLIMKRAAHPVMPYHQRSNSVVLQRLSLSPLACIGPLRSSIVLNFVLLDWRAWSQQRSLIVSLPAIYPYCISTKMYCSLLPLHRGLKSKPPPTERMSYCFKEAQIPIRVLPRPCLHLSLTLTLTLASS